MGPKDVILHTLETGDFVIKSYINDLSDEELKMVVVEGMHPIALQLGHLIASEQSLRGLFAPGSGPAVPEGFADAHDIKKAGHDPSGYRGKDEYLKLWDEQRAGTKAVLESLSDADLASTRDGTLPPFAPTVMAVLNLIGAHGLMHSGQFVAVRRKLNKPITI